MANVTNVVWIYPPKWDGNSPEPGANIRGHLRFEIKLTNLSDGTDETNVRKLDISNLRSSSGEICTKVIIDCVKYNVSGLNVLLGWDRAPQAEICRIFGANGAISGRITGPLHDLGDISDGTGDILLTTTGATSGDGYEIILRGRTV